MKKTKLILLGAGKIGDAILNLLSHTGEYELTVADRDPKRMEYVKQANFPNVTVVQADLSDASAVTDLISGHDVTLSACPYFLTPVIAAAAKKAKSHYFDLTEDVESTRIVKQLAEGAETAFVPQCGLAPGFISIVAADLARSFDQLDSVRMRVGALPAYPSNALNYNLTWSTEGVINEYCEPCEAIVDGRISSVPALEEREEFSLDGVLYEAFNTSGGLGTLCETLEGKVRTLNYRTIRYPGHAAIMKALRHDLRLKDRRGVLKDILENALPATLQDVVIVFVTVSGMREGRLQQETYARKIYSQVLGGRLRSAIQVTTASSLCAMLDLLATNRLPQSGFVRQEDVRLVDFLGNRFGQVYAHEAVAHAA